MIKNYADTQSAGLAPRKAQNKVLSRLPHQRRIIKSGNKPRTLEDTHEYIGYGMPHRRSVEKSYGSGSEIESEIAKRGRLFIRKFEVVPDDA